MKAKIITAILSLGIAIPFAPNSPVKIANAEEVNEHKLTVNVGTIKMGGTYGTTSAYYKLQATWCDYPDTPGSQYLDAGFIVNKVACDGSINMSYYANSESWTTSTYGCPYGAIRIKNNNIERIGSGDGQDGFFETLNTLDQSTHLAKGKFFSEISNPVTIRYDADAKSRTLPEYTFSTSILQKKGEASSYTKVADAYAGFASSYFGVGWYVGPFSCDLTNLCFWDDDYNSLGCTVDTNPTTCSLDLYGQVGKRIYIGGLQDDVETLVDQNNQTLPNVQNEGNGIFSFVMPDYDVTVNTKQKPTTLNITVDGSESSTSIEWSLTNFKSALDVSDRLSTNDIILGYKFDNKIYETVDDLYEYIETLNKSSTYSIEVVTTYLEMNKEATIRTVIGSTGMRFTGKVKGNVDEYGMIVTKYSNLESLDKFTMEDMQEGQYRKVSSLQDGFNYITSGEYKQFSTVVTNMKLENLIEQYVARLYVKVTYNTGETKIIYSALDESYLSLPYEAGLVSSLDLQAKAENDPDQAKIYNLKREAIHQYYDPVCNIDSSYHLIGNGRNYTVEKIEDGKIRIVPLNDMMTVSEIKFLLVNGVSVDFTRTDDIITFNGDYLKPITIPSPFNGGEVQLYNDVIKGYITAEDETTQISYLSTYSGGSYDKQKGTIRWNSLGSVVDYYLIYISEDNTFLDSYCFQSTGTALTPGVLIPNTTYYYKVVAVSDNRTFTQSDVDTFVTCDDHTLRQINISGVPNVRDEGGWTTETGQTVKYNLLYRGACLNGHSNIQPDSKGLYTINNVLHWKSEIDFRTTNDDDKDTNNKPQTANAFNSDYPYIKGTLTQAMYIFPGWSQTSPVARSYDSRTKNSLKAIFANLSDIDNYPAYFHCNAGADRTGTFGYIALGLLGVSYEDLCRDFELTSFSSMGRRWRSSITNGTFDPSGVMEDDSNNLVAFGKMHNYMMDNYGTGDGKVSSAINNYLVNAIGVPQEQIDAFKAIMLQ